MERSQYLGVYNNTSDDSKSEVPFRAAIRRGQGPQANWVNLGYCKTEAVAARVYNMYAINFFGKGAIINDITLNPQELEEFEAFINAKPKRQERLAEARTRAMAVLNGGNVFRKHTELERTTTVETPPSAQQAQSSTPQVPGVV